MRDIDDLLPEVLVYAPKAPEPVVHRYIREAARKLCHDVRLWRDNDEFMIMSPQCEGLITIADAEIVEIQEAWLNGHKLEPVTVGWLDVNSRGWDNQTEISTASYITQINPRAVSVSPRETGNCTVRLVLQPSRNSTTLPDVLVDLHGITLGRGAAAHLLLLPTSDFANPQLGLAMLSEFNAKVASLKTEHTKGQQGARLRSTGDWF
jgi:hypothetical protein